MNPYLFNASLCKVYLNVENINKQQQKNHTPNYPALKLPSNRTYLNTNKRPNRNYL